MPLTGESDTSNVHQLVLVHGRERARELVDARMRPLVDIAAEVLGDETQRIGISYTGFCLTALPHKKLADDQPWEKKGIASPFSSNRAASSTVAR